MRRFPLLLSLAALAGCVTTAGYDGPVALDQTAAVGPFRITPTKVREDSRCLPGVQCVWAGQVVVRATVDDGVNVTDRSFVLGRPSPDDRVMLAEVTPERSQGTEASVAAYRFRFAPVEREYHLPPDRS